MCSWTCGGIKRFTEQSHLRVQHFQEQLQEIQKGSLVPCVLARPRCTQGVLMFPESNQFLQRQGIPVY